MLLDLIEVQSFVNFVDKSLIFLGHFFKLSLLAHFVPIVLVDEEWSEHFVVQSRKVILKRLLLLACVEETLSFILFV